MVQTSAARYLKRYWPCCLATLAAVAALSVWHNRTGLEWPPVATTGPQAGKVPVVSPHAAARNGSAGLQLETLHHNSTSPAGDAEPSAGWVAGSQTVLENPGAVPAAHRAKSADVITAVPKVEDRLFGPALPRMAIYGGSGVFEPEAYRRC